MFEFRTVLFMQNHLAQVFILVNISQYFFFLSHWSSSIYCLSAPDKCSFFSRMKVNMNEKFVILIFKFLFEF